MPHAWTRRRLSPPATLAGTLVFAACVGDAESADSALVSRAVATTSSDYCEVPGSAALETLISRPAVDETPVDDVNWFARPVPHTGDDMILAFASHDQNYLYNLTDGVRVRIPDRSDAVATPDGRYMTVPSSYTPDSNVRFYPMAPLLEGLEQERDVDDVEPAFIHDHAAMSRVYYQSPSAGTTTCREIVDFGFVAGKADFSFDGSMLAFHISQGGYLTPFINGGLESSTITDIVVARLETNDRGDIVGHSATRRVTTSLEAGVGSYFPAFFPDGSLFYVANAVPKDSEDGKRFHFRVVDTAAGAWRLGNYDQGDLGRWAQLAGLWERRCSAKQPALSDAPFPMRPHEAPWLALSLTAGQCRALIDDGRAASAADGTDLERGPLLELCESLPQ